MTLAIELPEKLSAQLRAREVSDKEVQAIAVAALEMWLAQQPRTQNDARFAESAVPFTRQLIAQNRELFDALAKR